MIQADELLRLSEETVQRAISLGADEAEVYAGSHRVASVELQKDDIHNATTEEEATFGVRIFKDHREGFATVNAARRLERACEEALAMAAVTPPDELNGLADPRPVEALGEVPDPGIAALDVGRLVELANGLLEGVADTDARIRVDSGGVSAEVRARAVATSKGIRLTEEKALAGGNLFGMAVDGEDVGSFDYDSHAVRRLADLEPELEAVVSRFAIKTLGALGARKGESFRGTVVLTPEVVHSFVLGNLLPVIGGQAVRTGKSPLEEKLGEQIAAESVSLVDDAHLPWATGSAAFDREGTPTGRYTIIEHGILKGFLYDVYEGRAAGCASTGHARGGAASQPSIGTSNLVMPAGDVPMARLCSESGRCVVVTRFSGSTNPVTGEFSGVVKGGFLIKDGNRIPVKETLIAGNLYDLLKTVTGVSSEIRYLDGSAKIPALRVEDVSVTAG